MKLAVTSWPASSYGEVLAEGAADALRDATVHLALDDHRVDHGAAVLDHRVAEHVDLAGLRIDLDVGGVHGAREAPGVGRLVAARRLEARLDPVGKQMWLVAEAPRDVGETRRRAPGLPRTVTMPPAELQVAGARLEHVGCDVQRLLADVAGGEDRVAPPQ